MYSVKPGADMAQYVIKAPSICFRGTKYDFYFERVAYLHSILWRQAWLWLELFGSTSTVGRFFSRVSYLPSYSLLTVFRVVYAIVRLS